MAYQQDYCCLVFRSLDDPPDHPAFKSGSSKKPSQVQALITAVTAMARGMTVAGTSSTSAISSFPSRTASVQSTLRPHLIT